MRIAVAGDSAGEALAQVLAAHLSETYDVAEISRVSGEADAYYANLAATGQISALVATWRSALRQGMTNRRLVSSLLRPLLPNPILKMIAKIRGNLRSTDRLHFALDKSELLIAPQNHWRRWNWINRWFQMRVERLGSVNL